MFKILKSIIVIYIVFFISAVSAENKSFENLDFDSKEDVQDYASGFQPQIITDCFGDYVYAIWASDAFSHPIQVSISEDLGENWKDLISTPEGTTPPNLGSNGVYPQITAEGLFTYVVWMKNDYSSPIQIAVSQDGGDNWFYPSSTPTGEISKLTFSGNMPQITTGGSGENVYVIWTSKKYPNPVQVAISQDFGITWKDPISTPTKTSPNLASYGLFPQIISSSSDKAYAIWEGFENEIQVAISKDYGSTWQDPISTPIGTSPPNLVLMGASPQITTNSSGEYVYAIWRKIQSSSHNPIQVALSSDSGNTWQYPSYGPTDSSIDLAPSGVHPQITVGNSGKYVYAIWTSFSNYKPVQVARSQDFGRTWQYPDSTPTNSSPDLAASGWDAQITNSRNYVYAVWRSSNNQIQVARSQDFGKSWQYPDSSLTKIASNLADSGFNPRITTDCYGKRVYVIWRSPTNEIKIAMSKDYGLNWKDVSNISTLRDQ